MTEDDVARALAQARDVLSGTAEAEWDADWPYLWARVLIEMAAGPGAGIPTVSVPAAGEEPTAC